MYLDDYVKKEYGEKLYKVPINLGLTCPNRDGSKGTGGCIFCSAMGSGDFAGNPAKSVVEQITEGIDLVSNKHRGSKYIAYFQAYTNTYGPIEELKRAYYEAVNDRRIAVISIATRPDCLSTEILALLEEISALKPVWIELGLQTIHEDTARYINRCYALDEYDEAVYKLIKINIHHIVTHVILGLPGETREMMLETVKYVSSAAKRYSADRCLFGIKLQLLHVLKETRLAKDYEQGRFSVLSFNEYVDIVSECIRIIPENMVLHRITGDGDKRLLIAPEWAGDKKRVMNAINQRITNDEAPFEAGKSISIDGHDCHIYGNGPRIILYGTMNSVLNDTNRLVAELAQELSENKLTLFVYEVSDWNADFSPWEVADIAGMGSFLGKGDKTLDFIKNGVLPFLEKYLHNITPDSKLHYYFAGYSLAGLFSVWAFYEIAMNTKDMNGNVELGGVISASGSLWYPDFLAYASSKHIPGEQRYTTYLSVGGKEDKSPNPYVATVITATKRQNELFGDSAAIKNSYFELNRGGHFASSAVRIAKGIKRQLLDW